MHEIPWKLTFRMNSTLRGQLMRLMRLKGWNETSFIVRRALDRYLEEELRAFTPVIPSENEERPLDDKFAKTKAKQEMPS